MTAFGGLLYGMGSARFASQATSSASHAVSRAGEATREVDELEDRLDKLLLVSMAMWELLQECSDLTDEDLLKKVRELDLKDGQPDGKVTRTVAKCPKCDRVMSPKHARCLYCGATKLTHSAFDGV